MTEEEFVARFGFPGTPAGDRMAAALRSLVSEVKRNERMIQEARESKISVNDMRERMGLFRVPERTVDEIYNHAVAVLYTPNELQANAKIHQHFWSENDRKHWWQIWRSGVPRCKCGVYMDGRVGRRKKR